MKIARGAAAAAAVALAGCAAGTAGNGHGGTPVAQATGAGISYCMRDKLATEGGKLTCNWARTAREACEATALTAIASASVVAGPDKSTLCADGTPLVRVATK